MDEKVLEAIKELGRQGGKANAEKNGVEHMREISLKAVEAKRKKRALRKLEEFANKKV
jgi:hypothetical protein